MKDNIFGKRILITGGLGFIGSNLAHASCKQGAEVTVYDSREAHSGANDFNLSGIRDNVSVIIDDIRNSQAVAQAVIDKDILFHCAAHTSHPGSMKNPLKDVDVNCKGTITLLEAARWNNPAMKIVHIGTTTQIGKMVAEPIDELHPEFPADIYSANKTAAEKYTLIYGNAYGMHTTVLRLSNIYGPRSNIRSSDFGFINYFIGLALQGKELTVYGNGQQKRSVLHVDDAVDALLKAAVSNETDKEVFLISSDTQYTVQTVASLIVKYIGGSFKSILWPQNRKRIEIGDAVINNLKAKKILKWSAKVGLQKGLITTEKYFRKCLEEYIPG